MPASPPAASALADHGEASAAPPVAMLSAQVLIRFSDRLLTAFSDRICNAIFW
jgi:hypothetical protein